MTNLKSSDDLIKSISTGVSIFTIHEVWKKLVGNQYLKRCIEVALTGSHKITVVGNPDNGKEYLKIILKDLGLLTFIEPCKCGNFKDFKKECICNSDDIMEVRKTQKYQMAMNNPLIVKIESPVPTDLIRSSEDFESVLNRIATATEFDKVNNYIDKEFDLQKTAIELLEVAISRLNFTLCQIERVKSVSKTIAIMDGSNIIGPYHVSESIQYQILRKELLGSL